MGTDDSGTAGDERQRLHCCTFSNALGAGVRSRVPLPISPSGGNSSAAWQFQAIGNDHAVCGSLGASERPLTKRKQCFFFCVRLGFPGVMAANSSARQDLHSEPGSGAMAAARDEPHQASASWWRAFAVGETGSEFHERERTS